MKKLWLSEKMIAHAFWRELVCSTYKDEALADSKKIARVTVPLVDKFPSVAGSISIDSGMFLWLLGKYFSPERICEIGTYIGRSTLAMAFGSAKTVQNIYTCDGTYDCMKFAELDMSFANEYKVDAIKKIEYFGKTMSTVMLQHLDENNISPDMVFIDGRIGADDCKILTKICSEDCIFVLDDFDGVEKGVLNAVMLRGIFRGHILLEPPVMEKTGRVLNLAVLVPSNILSLSRQQSMPVNM